MDTDTLLYSLRTGHLWSCQEPLRCSACPVFSHDLSSPYTGRGSYGCVIGFIIFFSEITSLSLSFLLANLWLLFNRASIPNLSSNLFIIIQLFLPTRLWTLTNQFKCTGIWAEKFPLRTRQATRQQIYLCEGFGSKQGLVHDGFKYRVAKNYSTTSID